MRVAQPPAHVTELAAKDFNISISFTPPFVFDNKTYRFDYWTPGGLDWDGRLSIDCFELVEVYEESLRWERAHIFDVNVNYLFSDTFMKLLEVWCLSPALTENANFVDYLNDGLISEANNA